jgi:hypothetical protein
MYSSDMFFSMDIKPSLIRFIPLFISTDAKKNRSRWEYFNAARAYTVKAYRFESHSY